MKNHMQSPRGTQDILPEVFENWQQMLAKTEKAAKSFGFERIQTPTFEYTDLFKRSVGDTSDIVQKEMFTFEDRGGRLLTLRPEGTAAVVRAALQNGLLGGAMPLKLYYILNCFRNERPQAGRYKEFHQFGIELMGSALPKADAEVIALAMTLFKKLNIKNLSLRINSIGCKNCRKNYQKDLTNYFSDHKHLLCETCSTRLSVNPMRILDCKKEACKKIVAHAPLITDYLCEDCRKHFTKVQKYLYSLEIPFVLDAHIVRGLDYYTKTVFEITSDALGAQSTLCGGGRYDDLVEEIGGTSVPALGFAVGLERLFMVMKAQQLFHSKAHTCDVYIAAIGEDAEEKAMQMAMQLRNRNYKVSCDLCGRSLKAQMKYADKIGARFSSVLGDDEIKIGRLKIKDMKNGTETDAALNDFADTMQALLEKG